MISDDMLQIANDIKDADRMLNKRIEHIKNLVNDSKLSTNRKEILNLNIDQVFHSFNMKITKNILKFKKLQDKGNKKLDLENSNLSLRIQENKEKLEFLIALEEEHLYTNIVRGAV